MLNFRQPVTFSFYLKVRTLVAFLLNKLTSGFLWVLTQLEVVRMQRNVFGSGGITNWESESRQSEKHAKQSTQFFWQWHKVGKSLLMAKSTEFNTRHYHSTTRPVIHTSTLNTKTRQTNNSWNDLARLKHLLSRHFLKNSSFSDFCVCNGSGMIIMGK